MKKAFSFLLLISLLISCQEDILYQDNSSSSIKEVNQNDFESVMVDEPFIFISETDFFKWSHIDKVMDRFEACDIPDAQLKIMTTEALMKSILHYPLNYLLFAYHDHSQAIKRIMERSRLHREFVTRSDAETVLVNTLENTIVSFDETGWREDYKTLSYIDEMFLEFFIASEHVNYFTNRQNKDRLKKIVEIKLEERANDERYSINSLEPLIKINNKEKLGINNTYSYDNQLRSTIIHTYFGRRLSADDYPEYSLAEVYSITDWFELQYPDAYVYRPASRQYNCHFFAWEPVNLSGGNHWLESYNSFLVFQLDKFWTNDLYISCSESEAQKVYYYLDNHSAEVLSNGNYISKWDDGPVMVHAPDYGPYDHMLYRNYYKARTNLPLQLLSITGDTIIYPDEAHTYYQTVISNCDMTYVWSVRYWEDSTSPYSLQQIVLDEYQLICNDYGTFTIRVDGYFNGNNVAYGELNVNCIPDF